MTPFNINDPTQASFLATLNTGEGSPGPLTGVGYIDLSSAPQDAFGFPQWAGQMFSTGISHAAGLFQFEPGTWDQVAAANGLNFQVPADQQAGAWDLASSLFANRTGGDLESALQSGAWSSVQSALGSTWPTLATDAPPQAGATASSPGGATSSAAPTGQGDGGVAGAITQAAAGGVGFLQNVAGSATFVIVGIVLLGAGLYMLAVDKGVAPSPGEIVKGAGTAGAAAVAAA